MVPDVALGSVNPVELAATAFILVKAPVADDARSIVNPVSEEEVSFHESETCVGD